MPLLLTTPADITNIHTLSQIYTKSTIIMSNKYTNALIVTRWQDTNLFSETSSLLWDNATSYFPRNKAANA
jgi:hypothetical protein